MKGMLGRGERGQSIVEVALSLPVLVFGLLGGADLARAYAAQLAVQNAARAGAEAAVLRVATTDSAIVTAARNELAGVAGVNANAATITVTQSTVAGVSLVEVRVQYTHSTLIPWPGLPSSFTFDRTTTMRKFR